MTRGFEILTEGAGVFIKGAEILSEGFKIFVKGFIEIIKGIYTSSKGFEIFIEGFKVFNKGFYVMCKGFEKTSKVKIVASPRTRASTFTIRTKPTLNPKIAKELALLAPRLDTFVQLDRF